MAEHLRGDFEILRPPIKRLMLLGGMSVDKRKVDDFLRPFGSPAALWRVVKTFARYGLDRLSYSRGTDIGAGNALVARMFRSVRDLKADIRTIAEWGSATVISLTEADEMATLGVSHIGEEVAAAGMQWLHMPITDMKAPDDRFDAAWTTHGPQVLQQLQDGKRVLVHCRGGMGRAGTVAAFILTRLQVPAEFAIQQVRAVRRGAIETPHQIAWLEQTCPALPRT